MFSVSSMNGNAKSSHGYHRSLWLMVLVAMFMIGLVDSAQAETWRLATKMPPDNPEGKVFQRFANLVKEYSDGELEVKVYPSEQLGKTQATLEQLQAGTIHAYAEGVTFLRKWNDNISYLASAFLFDDRDHWERFMASDLVAKWLKDVEQKSGVMVVGGGPGASSCLRGPYRVMMTKTPWETLSEMQGIKLRMHDDELAVDIWNHLGAEVRVLGWTETYQAIDRGVVEAVNSEISLVETMKFYEVAPHIMRTDEYFSPLGFMVNSKSYHSLSPDVQDAVDRAVTEACKYSREVVMEDTAKAVERMKAKGVTYSAIDTSQFINRMESFYQQRKESGELPNGFLQAVEATR